MFIRMNREHVNSQILLVQVPRRPQPLDDEVVPAVVKGDPVGLAHEERPGERARRVRRSASVRV